MKKEKIYVDLDGVLCDFQKSHDNALIDNPTQRYPQSQWGFFLKLEEIPNAIEGFNLFVNRFPNSPKVEEAKNYIKILQDRLVEKSYMNARLYYNMKEYKASINALTNSLKEYSDSKYREEMMYLKLNSLFVYAEKSYINKQKERYQATLDDYFSFMEEYPESKYSKEVKKIYEDTAKYLKIKDTANLNNIQ